MIGDGIGDFLDEVLMRDVGGSSPDFAKRVGYAC